ncbi:unnamed protein product [Sphagnum balticum]
MLHVCKPTWFTSSFAAGNERAESGSEKNTNGDLKGSSCSLQPLPLLFTALLQCEDGGQFFATLAHKTADWLVVLKNTLTVGLANDHARGVSVMLLHRSKCSLKLVRSVACDVGSAPSEDWANIPGTAFRLSRANITSCILLCRLGSVWGCFR